MTFQQKQNFKKSSASVAEMNCQLRYLLQIGASYSYPWGYCEGVLPESVPSPGEESNTIEERGVLRAEGLGERKGAGECVRAREGGKFEVSLVEEGKDVMGESKNCLFGKRR